MMLTRQSVKVVDTSYLLRRYSRRQSELQHRQRTYRSFEHPKCFETNEFQFMDSNKAIVEKLRNEKDTLKAKLWAATGPYHTAKNTQALSKIKCLLDCYIDLSDEVQHTKISLTNLNHALSVLDKEVCHMKITERKRNKHNYEKAKKHLQNLEDHYEVCVHIECKLSYKSEKLRRIICELLHERKKYSTLYTKYIQKLNESKKYLTDLLHYSLNQIEISIHMYEKMEHSSKKYAMELERRKREVNDLQREHISYEITSSFQMKTSAQRPLAPIPQKNIKRLEQTRNKYIKKINLYNDILKKIRQYTNTHDVRSIIANFQEQENLYYSYFNYENEISYRMTLLNNSVGRLFKEIHFLKISNRDKQRSQNELMQNLKIILKEKRTSNERLRKMSESQDARIGKLFEALTLIRDQTRIDTIQLDDTFFDMHEVDLVNMRQQMKLLEQRIYRIVVATYWLERHNPIQTFPTSYLVKGLDKIIDYTTKIDLIVPATQCAECAEVDVKNLDDDETNESITPLKLMKKYVADRVIQPDMQYRLHDIMQCRLPRSRYLAHRQSIA